MFQSEFSSSEDEVSVADPRSLYSADPARKRTWGCPKMSVPAIPPEQRPQQSLANRPHSLHGRSHERCNEHNRTDQRNHLAVAHAPQNQNRPTRDAKSTKPVGETIEFMKKIVGYTWKSCVGILDGFCEFIVTDFAEFVDFLTTYPEYDPYPEYSPCDNEPTRSSEYNYSSRNYDEPSNHPNEVGWRTSEYHSRRDYAEPRKQPYEVDWRNSEYHSRRDYAEPRKQPYEVGLRNLGATCYVNATVQILMSIPNLMAALCEMDEGRGETRASLLRRIFQDRAQGYITAPSTNEFVSSLTQLNSDYDYHTHQDANEFLLRLLDDLRTCLPDAIKADFDFQVAENRTCLSCRHVNKKSNSDLSIILPIVDDATTLQQLLASEYGKKETRSIECPNCKHEEIEIDNKLETLPNILIVSVNRFSADCKLTNKIEVSRTLDVALIMQNPLENSLYELKALLVHQGLSTIRGHYICYILGPDHNWRVYNDLFVRQVALFQCADQWERNGYIFFYQRVPQSNDYSLTSR